VKNSVNGKVTGLLMGLAVLAAVPSVEAAPIYSEDFAGNVTNDPKTAVNGVTTISGEAAHVVTTAASQEGAIVVSGLSTAAASEYTVSWDVTVNGATEGANFYAILPFNGGIHDIWILFADDGTGDWEFQVKDAGGNTNSDADYSYGDTVGFQMHHTGNVDDEIDLYVDGALFGTFTDLSPTKSQSLLLFGDGSGGTSTGNVTYDNLSVIEGPVPEPASLVLMGLGAITMLRRRQK